MTSEYATKYRTHTCGELRTHHIARPKPGQKVPPVVLAGHVDRKLGDRMLVLRDHYGKTVVTVSPDALPYVEERFKRTGLEDVVQVSGVVRLMPEKDQNLFAGKKELDLPTGEVCLQADKVEILSPAFPPPPDLLASGDVAEQDRYAYRNLYLRRPEMQEKLAFRASVTREVHRWAQSEGFLEIETPHMFWYDPVAGGGETIPDKDGKAWRTPSGPVVLNQYVKAGQFERFYQFTRVTRRERTVSPMHTVEHTALDVNAAFLDWQDFLKILERMFVHVWKAVRGEELKTPFKSFSYEEAVRRFGTDRVDARFGLELEDMGGGRGFRAPGGAGQVSEADMADLSAAAPGGAVLTAKNEGKDLVVVAKHENHLTMSNAAGYARVEVARRLGLIDESKHELVWVHSYPLFETDEFGNEIPRVVVFTQILDEDAELLADPEKNKMKIRGKAFDLFMDGVEIASGYMGNTDLAVQRLIWEKLFGMKVGELFRLRAPIESHRFGIPPHGGLNVGYDRLIALLLGADRLDEVMYYPKWRECRDLLLGAPGPVPKDLVADVTADAVAPKETESDLGEEVAKL